jgi:uncharacterized membrane protein YjgN (DUF898 family)
MSLRDYLQFSRPLSVVLWTIQAYIVFIVFVLALVLSVITLGVFRPWKFSLDFDRWLARLMRLIP